MDGRTDGWMDVNVMGQKICLTLKACDKKYFNLKFSPTFYNRNKINEGARPYKMNWRAPCLETAGLDTCSSLREECSDGTLFTQSEDDSTVGVREG